MYFPVSLCLALLVELSGLVAAKSDQKQCLIKSSGSNATDDAPAILEAFHKCGRNGRVIFEPTTYYVNSIMNISWLENVDIEIHGKLLTFYIGNNVRINGYGKGNLDGNGDYWYQWIRKQPNTSNYPGRPHAVTFNGLKNSVINGLTFLRSQMWTMSIINSHHVLLDNIMVNNTGNWAQSSNTDGADTIYSSHITFNNWTVYNGDDSISLKANSTDIAIANSKFYNGLGIAIGSIGQYNDQFETIERLAIQNVQYENTLHAFYVKTWTDDQNGYPPNGGGGGLGFALTSRFGGCFKHLANECLSVASDLTLRNLTATGLRGAAFAISQCTRFSGAPGQGNCTNSQFQIRNVAIEGLSGTSKSAKVASLQCSGVAPCTDINISDTSLHLENGTLAASYLCGNVENPIGFKCTGTPCVGGSATGEC
ncbi:uncharacterized protein N7506_004438 [Penicillium brevicompactum]|uniref:uncharacterized protein n=1 Tax=Penicillium brevicompactum TaxID=5074 RepID=UPI002541DFB9|nr:uncharacterized protein N7506_004438 [Penicillium brevicompactum]KAJ5336416.1 hypothetical protein N7506_004438 [Penicillium brevicompactum]